MAAYHAGLMAGQRCVRIPEVLIVVQGSEVLEGTFYVVFKLIYGRAAQYGKVVEYVAVQTHTIGIQSAVSFSPSH
jgi:hypothetical protein